VLAPALISPVGPEQYGTGLGGTVATRGTGLGNWYVNRDGVTLTLLATDNVAIAKFQYSLGGADAPFVDFPDIPRGGTAATGSVVITKEGTTVVRYRALDASGNASDVRSVTVQIDTRAPEVTFPSIVNNRVPRTTPLKPSLSDPTPGSGGAAVRSA